MNVFYVAPDNFFPDEERIVAAQRLAPEVKAAKARIMRADRKAVESLGAWFSKTGSPLDVIEYELAAAKHQLEVRKLASIQKRIYAILNGEEVDG
jgi:hypothetical protein